MSLVETEQVLVIPTEEFHRLGYFQGFSSEINRYFPELLQGSLVSYRPRGEMEVDPSFKQLIPYVVFRHTVNNNVRLFQYSRGKGQGEARLRTKKSVGVGGHISTLDADAASTIAGADVYEQGLRRELEEEVDIQTNYVQRCVGLINDDETDVGRVHLGIVHLFDVEQPSVQPREVDILDAGFHPVDQIFDDLAQFESWSQIVVRSLFGRR